MLKTLRDSNKRVVGVEINHRKFSLPKEIGHALGLEEDLCIKKAREASAKIADIKKHLSETTFFGEARCIRTSVQFHANSQINTLTGKIEFLNDLKTLDATQKQLCLEVVNMLLIAINQAIDEHTKMAKAELDRVAKATS